MLEYNINEFIIDTQVYAEVEKIAHSADLTVDDLLSYLEEDPVSKSKVTEALTKYQLDYLFNSRRGALSDDRFERVIRYYMYLAGDEGVYCD